MLKRVLSLDDVRKSDEPNTRTRFSPCCGNSIAKKTASTQGKFALASTTHTRIFERFPAQLCEVSSCFALPDPRLILALDAALTTPYLLQTRQPSKLFWACRQRRCPTGARQKVKEGVPVDRIWGPCWTSSESCIFCYCNLNCASPSMPRFSIIWFHDPAAGKDNR